MQSGTMGMLLSYKGKNISSTFISHTLLPIRKWAIYADFTIAT